MKTNIQVLTCDRCGWTDKSNPDDLGPLYLWGKVSARSVGSKLSIGSDKTEFTMPEKSADICPECTEFLRNWWSENRD